jgi:hypothetical protein
VFAEIVQRSLFMWLPLPSVTHKPLELTSQYAEPLTIVHIPGGDGDLGGAGGGTGSGGGEGGGTRGMGADGGSDVLAQMVKPPLVTEPSVLHDMV